MILSYDANLRRIEFSERTGLHPGQFDGARLDDAQGPALCGLRLRGQRSLLHERREMLPSSSAAATFSGRELTTQFTPMIFFNVA
jgi:hypothetical protein